MDTTSLLPAARRRRSLDTLVRSAFALGMLALLPLAACEELPHGLGSSDPSASRGPRQGTLYGAAVEVGNGRARSYVVLQEGAPVEFGVALSEAALTGLPAGDGHGGDPHAHTYDYLLPVHPQNPTPYRFVGLNWNPAGHEPPGIYDLPHFDFHFYTISEEERDAIDPLDPEYGAKAGRFPAPEFLPEGYLAASTLMNVDPALAAIPRMGMHWIDPATPELNGVTFTETFLYGTWDGRMIFAEPMITKAFLESRPSFEEPIAQASQYDPAGYYPGSYRIYWDQGAREYRVALSEFSYRG